MPEAGKLKDDLQIKELIKEGYGIAPDERIGVLGIGMSSNYEKYKEQMKQILKELEIFNQKQDFCAYAIEMRGRQSFVVLFYHMGNEQETYRYLEQTIVPMICNTARGRVICTWAVSDDLKIWRSGQRTGSCGRMESDSEEGNINL